MNVQSDNLANTSVTNNTSEGTTQLVAQNVEAIVSLPRKIPSIYDNSYFPNDVTSVISYLSKPVPINSGSWSTGSTAGTLLFNQRSWTGIFNNVMWKEKLHGFYGLRATLRVDFILNATPFHQGLLRVCYYPVAVANPIKASLHNTHRVPLSQLPGVNISCSDTSVSLSIPYVAPGRYIEMTSAGFVYDWGDIYVAIMDPLQVGAAGDANVDYTIWYSLHDVELFGQTNKAIQQSGIGKGKAKRIMPAEHEERPISYVLGAAANFAESVAKIPILSPWASPVSWFLNAAKGAAYSFGFSKPISTEKPCMMSNNYNWHTTTADGLDNSIPLSLLYDAKLKLLDDVSDKNQDQMSIDFIKSQWSFFTSFQLSEADTLGLQKFRQVLQPSAFVVSPGSFEFYYTPVAYLSTLFGLYRGGIEIMLKFVKTGFHSGSVAVTYIPGPNDTTMTFTDSSYAYRTVLDLQEGSQACFRCPYLLPHDYFEVSIPYGAFYVHVVNPIRSPETCSSTIDVLVYVRGAESLQFNKPRPVSTVPVVPQGGDVENFDTITCDAPGDSPVAPLNLSFAQDSMSECALSVLQLLKRYVDVQFEWVDEAANDILTVLPWVVGAGRFFSSIYTPPRQIYDPITSFILAPFAFYRGSTRLRITPISSGADVNTPYMCRIDDVAVSGFVYVTSQTSTSTTTLPYGSSYTIASVRPRTMPPATNTYGAGGLSVSCPYQNVYRMCPIQYTYLSSNTADFFTPRVRVSVWTGTSKNRLISRSFGDDFQALFWVGVPRMNQ